MNASQAGYVVAVDSEGAELSQRISGRALVASGPRGVGILFVPDEGTGSVELAIERGGSLAGWQIRDNNDAILYDSRFLDPTADTPGGAA